MKVSSNITQASVCSVAGAPACGVDWMKSLIGGTLVLPVNRYQSLKLYSISGYNAHREHDFQAFGIAWQYRWGGGY